MVKSAATRRRIGSAVLGIACMAIAVAAAWSIMAGQSNVSGAAAKAAADITGSTGPVDKAMGPSGLPLPRFVSLKADKINVRRGPSSEHQVAWVYQRNLAVLHTDETAMALVAPWRKQDAVPMYSGPSTTSNLVAMVKAGVVATLEDCTGEWCSLSASGYEGWIAQPMIWGAYPGERVEK